MDKEKKNYFQTMASKAEKQFMESEQYEQFINATPQEKLDTLNSRKSKTPTMDYMPNYDKMLEHIKAGKPVLCMSIGTTGLKSESAEIMQTTMLLYDVNKEGKKYQSFKDGGMKDLADKGFSMDKTLATFVTVVDNDMIDIADISKKNTGYDIFAEGGFDRPISEGGLGITEKDYRNACAGKMPNPVGQESKDKYGDKTYSILGKNEFANNISQWLEYAKKIDAMIICVSPDFARPFLKNVGVKGFPDNAIDIQELARCHDYSEVLKEMKNPDYKGDYLSRTGKGYQMTDFSNSLNSIDHLYSTRQKVLVCRNTLEDILVRENVLDKSVQKTAELNNDSFLNGYVLKSFDAVKATKDNSIVSYTTENPEKEAPKSAVPNGLVIKGKPVEAEIGNKPKEVTENADPKAEVPAEEDNLQDVINARVEKELQERYGKIMATIEQIANCLFAIEKDVKELKSVKEISKPKRKRMTKAEKEALEKEKAKAEAEKAIETEKTEETKEEVKEVKAEEPKTAEAPVAEAKADENAEPVKAEEENTSLDENDDKDER